MIVATRIVPRRRTELPIADMMVYGADAYKEIFNKQVSTYVLATAASQWTTECGIKPGTNKPDGSKVIYNIWNNNWGNITCKPDADFDKHSLTTKERIKKDPDPIKDIWKTMTLYYKAYKTPLEGASDYWIKLRDRFPKSLAAFYSGNPKIIAETLSKEGYYTDLVSRYVANLDYFFPRYVKLLLIGSEV